MRKGVRQFFSSLVRNPQKALLFYLFCSIACWTLQCSLLQNVLGLDVIEVLTWGRQGLVWGHAKHPPLSGWLAGILRTLSGGGDWGLYLGAQLAMTGGIWFTYLLGMRLLHDRFLAAAGALLLCFLHYYTPSEMRFCTYPVAMFLNPLIVWSFVAAGQSRKTVYFLLCGFACALAVLNKYSCGVLLTVLLICSFCDREYRTCWRTPGPWLTGILFAALTTPHLIWLCRHDFVCLRHVGTRLTEEFRWYDPLLTMGATVYPFAAELLVLGGCAWLTRRALKARKADWQICRRMLFLTLPSCAVLILSACLGKSVILMWFCTLASFTGIAAVAAFPFEFRQEQFRVFYGILWIFAAAVFIGCTADLLFSSRERLHADPQTVIRIGRQAWQESGYAGPVPVILGDRWYGGVFENYSAEAAPCAEIGDPVALERHRALIEKRGALLLFSDEEQLDELRPMVKKDSFFIRRVEYTYSSLLGRKRSTWFLAGYLKPHGLLPEKENGK